MSLRRLSPLVLFLLPALSAAQFTLLGSDALANAGADDLTRVDSGELSVSVLAENAFARSEAFSRIEPGPTSFAVVQSADTLARSTSTLSSYSSAEARVRFRLSEPTFFRFESAFRGAAGGSGFNQADAFVAPVDQADSPIWSFQTLDVNGTAGTDSGTLILEPGDYLFQSRVLVDVLVEDTDQASRLTGSGVVNLQAVPEPASMAALGLGLAGLARRRRRTRRV